MANVGMVAYEAWRRTNLPDRLIAKQVVKDELPPWQDLPLDQKVDWEEVGRAVMLDVSRHFV